MPISARNKLTGKVMSIETGMITAKVQLDVGGQKLTSIVSKDAVNELGLKEGDSVDALIKATSVMLMN
ncbi:MAG: TOBE domain-containing protein [Clostridia bacterium]|nr:TOBE domain-containing protein [Clostridia bacterium]